MSRADNLTGTAVARRQNTGGDSLQAQIERLKPQLARALPSHIKDEMMIRSVLTELRRVPKLGLCSKESFFGALFDCASMGLTPGPLGLVYLIPYGNECTLQIGYKGLLELVRRSQRVDDVFAYPVFEGDDFEYSLGLRPDIKHIPVSDDKLKALRVEKKLTGTTRQLTHVYAVAYIKDMTNPRIEVMTKDQVIEIMGRSAAAKGKSSPWTTDFAEMARKTVLKRLCKTLPLSAEIASHINRDERVSHLVDIGGEFAVQDAGSIHDREEEAPAPAKTKNKAAAPAEEAPEVVDEETGEITEQGPAQKSLLDD